MAVHLRKRVAQVGVLLFIASSLTPLLTLPFLVVGGDYSFTAGFALALLPVPVLLLAALLPENPDETWGCIWPLSGYDNAIDAIYVRGPWLQRFQELDEAEAERRVSTAMSDWF